MTSFSLSKKRVAVIGAGPSGLTAARQAQQNGCQVCVFERMDAIGGVWKMANDKLAARRPLPPFTAFAISKELCAFSEFPIPDFFPTFLRPSDALAYLQLYADKFLLMEHIKLRAEVRKIQRAEFWEESGTWTVRWIDMDRQEAGEKEEEFDAVLLCTGMRQRSWRPPEWRLEKAFKGRVLHAEQFHSPTDFLGQTVGVVGLGNSAVEIATALAPTAKQVLLSTRRGGCLLSRFCCDGRPWGRHFHTRWHSLSRRWVPKMVRSKFCQWTADWHSLLAVNPSGEFGNRADHNLLNSHFTFGAEQLGWHLACGRIRLKPEIWSLSDGNSVEFVDGSVEEGLDAIILCTGYQFDFGFVEDGTLLPVQHNDFHLYKHMFAPELYPHHNLAVIGHVQPIGGCIWPIAELQSRLFFEVLNNKTALPSPFWMKAELEKRRCGLSVNYVKTRRHTQMEDHVQFCVELARMVGADSPPSFHRLLLSDPRLAFAIWLGPLTPSQFRLWGPFPSPWHDACRAVLAAQRDNCLRPCSILFQELPFSILLALIAVFLMALCWPFI